MPKLVIVAIATIPDAIVTKTKDRGTPILMNTEVVRFV
jgi:hypothetical protein